MQRTRSTLIAVGLPALLLLLYLAPSLKPAARISAASSLTPSQSSELWKGSSSLLQQGRYTEALADVMKLHEAYPGNHLYLERAAELYGRLGQQEKEAEFWEKYFDRAPNPLTACPQIGQAYWKQEKRAQAISAFERCLALDPDNSDSIFFLAHALETSGQTDRAAELYVRGMKLAPGYSDLQIGLARVRLRQGKLAAAKIAVMGVLRRSPRNVDALLAAGLIEARLGDLAEAKQHLERGASLSDGYLDFHAALAEIAEKEKDFPEAIRQYNRILQDHPEDQDVRSRRDALIERP